MSRINQASPLQKDEDVGIFKGRSAGKIQEILEKLESIIDKSGGILVKKDDWGLRKLAYEIKRSTKGRYFLLDFAGPADLIVELERRIKIMESILRFLTIKKEDVVDMELIKKEQEEEKEREAAKKAAALEREKETREMEQAAPEPEAEQDVSEEAVLLEAAPEEAASEMSASADDALPAEETDLPEVEEIPEAEDIEEIKE